ncbi:HU family DNA-binding protein [Caulobacter hibisci]|uniref:HU family DNA-binding protein n=1 Tax=Caulobacter hibisci TaxID=2035993 RepID=A0ABS0ST50_9CAUL|nr:HU family DNA-binding protein [Caulobacter hibisci]MBI1682763.1 HU family DNA-binding protein [Caulobacter hibisci]
MNSSARDSGAPPKGRAEAGDRPAEEPVFDIGRAFEVYVGDMLTRSLCRQIRQALLKGKVVELPGLGRFEIRDKRRYGLVNPSSGARADLGGERAIVWRPDRKLLRDLNSSRGDV